MKYYLKKEVAEKLKKKYRSTYFIEAVGISKCYTSLILNRKRHCPKRVAYCFTKAIDENAEIDDFFEVA